MKKGKFLPLVLTSFLMYNCASVSTFLDYRKREFAIYDCLKKASRIEYVSDGKTSDGKPIDYWQTPKETEEREKGDCEDKSNYLQYLLLNEGIKAYSVYGKRYPSDETNHVWIELEKNGEWYVLDPNYESGWVYKKRKDINSSNYVPYKRPYSLNKSRDYIKRSYLNK